MCCLNYSAKKKRDFIKVEFAGKRSITLNKILIFRWNRKTKCYELQSPARHYGDYRWRIGKQSALFYGQSRSSKTKYHSDRRDEKANASGFYFYLNKCNARLEWSRQYASKRLAIIVPLRCHIDDIIAVGDQIVFGKVTLTKKTWETIVEPAMVKINSNRSKNKEKRYDRNRKAAK